MIMVATYDYIIFSIAASVIVMMVLQSHVKAESIRLNEI